MSATNARQAWAETGLVLLAGAVVCAAAGAMHMLDMLALTRAYGVICGSGSGVLAHCPACLGSLMLSAASAVALARSQAQPLRVR